MLPLCEFLVLSLSDAAAELLSEAAWSSESIFDVEADSLSFRTLDVESSVDLTAELLSLSYLLSESFGLIDTLSLTLFELLSKIEVDLLLASCTDSDALNDAEVELSRFEFSLCCFSVLLDSESCLNSLSELEVLFESLVESAFRFTSDSLALLLALMDSESCKSLLSLSDLLVESLASLTL